jgi:hypothetical protein
MRAPLKRRSFLKGAGVAIALPMLEAMVPNSYASCSGQRPVKRFVCLSNNYGMYRNGFFPTSDQVGAGYEMPETLQALEQHRNQLTIFSNLDHGNTGGHAGVPVLLSGVRPSLAHGYSEGNLSLDQKLADFSGTATRFPSMTIGCNEQNLISFTRAGVQVPTIDMRAAYRLMFLDDPTARKATALERLKRQNSILDVVMGQAKSLQRQLGKQDQQKLDEYFGSVRSLEKKIVQQEPWIVRPKPQTDVLEPQLKGGTPDRLKATIEMIALALQTDSTRVVTCVSGFANGDFGLSGGYHNFSHHGERAEPVAALKKIEGNQIGMMAYLIELLQQQKDVINGGTLLDHTTILFGCGMATGTHQTRNLPLLLAGGGYQHGEHKVFPEVVGRTPAANLLLSILQNHGVEADRFGTSSGTLTGLGWSSSQ